MNYVRHLFLLAGTTLIGFALYLLMFWAGVGASITILFYRGVVLAVAAAVAVGLAAGWFRRGRDDGLLPTAAAAVALSFNICFLVLLPVTVDRSVTVYLLSAIEQRQVSGIDPAALRKTFIDGYAVEMKAVDRRIDEQQKSGNISVAPDGRIRLTKQGQRFMALSRTIGRLFGTDPRFVGQPVDPAKNRHEKPGDRG